MDTIKTGQKIDLIKKYGLHLVALWSIIAAAALGYNIYSHHQAVLKEAATEARTYYDLNLAYRLWVSDAGGVYVSTDAVAPNPYLNVPSRDITIKGNKHLTLVNPAYMTRLVFEIVRTRSTQPVINRLTSIKYLNPSNRPNEWESKSLLAFDKGTTEAIEVDTIGGRPYLKLMKPFMAEKSCLKCHGHQGYKAGDVRGGMSVSVPLQPYYANETKTFIRLSGTYFLLWLTVTAGLVRFSTGRYRQEQRLKKSEDNFRMLFNKSADAIFLVKPDGSIADVNDIVCRRYQYSREELLSMNISQIDSPATRNLAPERTARVMEKGPVVFEAEHITKDGELIPVEANASFILLGGQPVLLSACRDISERKKAQEALADEKERLAVTLRSIGDAVIVTDIAGSITLINKVAEDLTGWKSDDAVGKPFSEVFNIINESTREKCEDPVQKVLRTGMVIGLDTHTALIRKDGSEIIIADSAAPIQDSQSRTIGIILVFRDITAQYRMAQEMQKMQKLESLGLLAGGLAHDFNNLLTSIIGNVSLVKMQIGVEHKSFSRLTDAEKAARRATDITHQLLTFAKGGAPVKKPASISEIAKESCHFATSGAHAKCVYTIPPSLWSVAVDKGQMSQVFNNLIINSIHAMSKGGMIHLGFENVTLRENQIAPLKQGDYVKITIRDEGIGISEENLSKIFAPYFTTKPNGTGLGLATVLSIVNRHEGHISVESKPGKGAAFTIYIPAIKDTIASAAQESGVQAGRGKILVMDDEELIRNVAGEILKELGYEVAFAKDGKEAIEAYLKAEREKKPFDVVIMDLTVPGGMGGKEAAANLLAVAPGSKIIVSSGYSMDPIMADYRKFGFCGVVRKPYNANEISEAIAKVI
jgi:PAS domain S-box-containing protein